MTGVVLPDEVVSEAMRSDVTWDRLVAEMPVRETIERELIPSSGRVRDGSGS